MLRREAIAMNPRRVLVLGATGSFGRAMAAELRSLGWPVRALIRDPDRLLTGPMALPGLEVAAGDALDPVAVDAAAEGCAAIVHAVSLPYPQWPSVMPRVTDNVIAAAARRSAVVLFPGNVYGFGRQTGKPLTEKAPMRPDTRKGALRVALEDRLAEAARQRSLKAVILRAGDFFGPTVRNGLVDRIFGNAARGKPIKVLGRTDVVHQWAYVPDLARVGADLLAMADLLEPVEIVHFRGHVADPHARFLGRIAALAGRPGLRVRRINWRAIQMLALFRPMARELLELRYLFDDAVVLDDPRRRDLLPTFTPTPLDDAIRQTLTSYRREYVPRRLQEVVD
ncbi:MAG: NAD-dependent epimerase/dehydratase family protein [Rhodospirillales bacterium]|nr:MAG: NAD-dependent epimerase/dehydratase family protein [Rhodospirillales bacterium]